MEKADCMPKARGRSQACGMHTDAHAMQGSQVSPPPPPPARVVLATTTSPQLTLAEAWLLAIRDGRCSVADVCEWAGLRADEGGADDTIKALARCTQERSLHSWVEKQPWRKALPEPYAFKAPVRQRDGGIRMQEMLCLLPHDMVASLFENFPGVALELFGTEGEREHFWAKLDRTARELPAGKRAAEHRRWVRSHPALQGSDPACRLAIGMHGDAGQMHGGEKITAVSWGGLVRKGSTLDTRLLFIVVKRSEELPGHATLFRALRTLAWSLRALSLGVHPATDEDGQAFGPEHLPDRAAKAGQPLHATPQGNIRGAWCELRGDWEFLRDVLHLQNYWQTPQMCHFCQATKEHGALYYGNPDAFGREGPLRETLVGPQQNSQNAWASPVSPVTEIPGFSIWRCQFDLMHTLELGVLQKVVPAALQGLMGIAPGTAGARVNQGLAAFKGTSRVAQCMAATLEYQRWAKTTRLPSGSRVKQITPRWVQGLYPEISTEHAKAAALRAMLPWVAALALQHRRLVPSEAADHQATCLQELAALDGIYKRKPRFLTLDEESQAATHCIQALRALQALVEMHPAGPWKLIPKVHALHHIALDSAMHNPRLAHCYQDEDFIRLVKRMYVRCHGKTAPTRSVQRYALGLAIQLTAREEVLQGKRKVKARQARGGPLRGVGRRASGSSEDPGGTPPSAPAQGIKRGRGRPPKAKPLAKRPRGRPRKVR